MARSPEPLLPWFTSPLLPVVAILAGLVLLLLDGLTPYETWWRRNHWKPVKGRLARSVQKRRSVRTSAAGQTPLEYLSRVPQKRIFNRVVTRGWPLKRKKRIWQIRITYTYPWKGKRLTRIGDQAPHEYESRRSAESYLRSRIKREEIRVWVNPDDPKQATAFLEQQRVLYLWLGFALVPSALLWLIMALLLRRAHLRRQISEQASE